MKEITLNGYILTVEPNLLTIYDPFDELNRREAEVLVSYCYDEGFITQDEMECEIIKGIDGFDLI